MVPRIDIEEADKLIQPHRHASWKLAMGCLMSKEKLKQALSEAVTENKEYEADITLADLRQLISHGYIEKTNNPIAFVRCRTEMEKQDEYGAFSRRRFLSVPELFNAFFLDPGAPMLHSITKHIQDAANAHVNEGSVAIVSDAPSFFVQFPLPSDVRDYYSFSFAGEYYRLTTIPTGGRQSPSLAEALMGSLAERAALDGAIPGTHIDNVRFVGTPDAVMRSWELFVSLAKSINMAMDPFDCTPTTLYTFLGVQFSHSNHVAVQLAQKSWSKLLAWQGTPLHEITLREAMMLFGQCVWARRVKQKSLADLYWILKFLRRKASIDACLDCPANIWNSTVTQWLAMYSDALKNEPTIWEANDHHEARETFHLYSDASLTGWGVVVFHTSGNISVSAGTWKRHEQIHILEARALRYGLKFFLRLAPEISNAHVRVWVDNTSLLGAIAKGHSRSFLLNVVVLHIQEEMRHLHARKVTVEFDYVHTSANFADGPSRGKSSAKLLSGNELR